MIVLSHKMADLPDDDEGTIQSTDLMLISVRFRRIACVGSSVQLVFRLGAWSISCQSWLNPGSKFL